MSVRSSSIVATQFNLAASSSLAHRSTARRRLACEKGQSAGAVVSWPPRQPHAPLRLRIDCARSAGHRWHVIARDETTPSDHEVMLRHHDHSVLLQSPLSLTLHGSLYVSDILELLARTTHTTRASIGIRRMRHRQELFTFKHLTFCADVCNLPGAV